MACTKIAQYSDPRAYLDPLTAFTCFIWRNHVSQSIFYIFLMRFHRRVFWTYYVNLWDTGATVECLLVFIIANHKIHSPLASIFSVSVVVVITRTLGRRTYLSRAHLHFCWSSRRQRCLKCRCKPKPRLSLCDAADFFKVFSLGVYSVSRVTTYWTAS